MAVSHGKLSSVRTRTDSRVLAETLTNLVDSDQGSMNKDSLASESPSMLSIDGNWTNNNSSGSESVEETTSDIYDGFLKAVSAGSCLDIISQHIENLERDIAATSSTEVKSKLSKYSSSNLTDMRAAIIKYCKQANGDRQTSSGHYCFDKIM